MTIKARLIAVLAVILLVFSGSAVVTLVNLNAQLPKLERTENNASSVADLSIPMAILIKDIQLDVVQVQQWITDISATRGLPGFDDGFTEAAAYAEKFKEDVGAAREFALALELNEVVVALNEVEKAFDPFYETGVKMGQTYVDKGPEAGNVMMEQFDGVAGAMGENMEALLEKVSESTGHKLEELQNSIHGVQSDIESVETLNVILTAIGVVIGLAAAAYLVVLIKGSIEGLVAEIQKIADHEYGDGTCKGCERTDEFGAVARALQETKLTLIAAEEREQAQQETDLRQAEERKAERLRMAEQFETSVGTVVETVAAAAIQMQGSAQGVSTTADQTSQQASNVAAAAEQASANVQTVASAAEELSSSISEISRQVSQSTQIAGTAVAEVEGANDKVQGLADAANKIGQQVGLDHRHRGPDQPAGLERDHRSRTRR